MNSSAGRPLRCTEILLQQWQRWPASTQCHQRAPFKVASLANGCARTQIRHHSEAPARLLISPHQEAEATPAASAPVPRQSPPPSRAQARAPASSSPSPPAPAQAPVPAPAATQAPVPARAEAEAQAATCSSRFARRFARLDSVSAAQTVRPRRAEPGPFRPSGLVHLAAAQPGVGQPAVAAPLASAAAVAAAASRAVCPHRHNGVADRRAASPVAA